MKKMICLCVIVLVLFSVAQADDLKQKTDEELLSMYHEIQTILLSRDNVYGLELNAGKYVIGKDIPAGTYRIECKGSYGSATVALYESVKSTRKTESHILAELYGSAVIGKIELNEGNILEIGGSALTLTSYSVGQISVSSSKVKEDSAAQTKSIPTDGIVVSAGKYLVGEDIPAGTYRVVCKGAYSMATVEVYDSERSLFPSYTEILSELFGSSEIGKIELKQGNYVQIGDGSVTLYEYNGIR